MNSVPSNRLPVTLALTAFGVLVTAIANRASAMQFPYAMLIFWAGVLLIFLPGVAFISHRKTTRAQIIGMVAWMGMLFYLISLFRSPAYLSEFDELLHYRTAWDILQTGHLFTYNPSLAVSSYYPGLEIITTAIIQLTGLSIYHAGIAVIATARLLFCLAMVLLLENVCQVVFPTTARSAAKDRNAQTDRWKDLAEQRASAPLATRAAGMGASVYICSSTFVFFDSQFAYESLSIALAFWLLYLLTQRASVFTPRPWAWSLAAGAGALALIVTHHTTVYWVMLLLGLWVVVGWVFQRRNPVPIPGTSKYSPMGILLILLAGTLLWLLLVAQGTIQYLAPHITDGGLAMLNFLYGEGGNRAILNTSATGTFDAERITALLSVAFILLGLALGAVKWWKVRRIQTPLSITMALSALLYPLIPVLRLNSSTWEISNRMAGFVFLPLGFMIGIGLASPNLPHIFRNLRRFAVLPALALMICGGIIAGSNPQTRLPGPYRIEADNRSIDQKGLNAATWASQMLGPNQRMVGDRVQANLMGSYGTQRMVFRYSDGVNISSIFLSETLGDYEREVIQTAHIRYLVVDRRISAGLPLFGYYYEHWEDQVIQFTPPPSRASLQKFDQIAGVSRVYDNGDIVIYDLGAQMSGQ